MGSPPPRSCSRQNIAEGRCTRLGMHNGGPGTDLKSNHNTAASAPYPLHLVQGRPLGAWKWNSSILTTQRDEKEICNAFSNSSEVGNPWSGV